MGYIDDLTEFGLTRQEATIYYELLKANGMTGYEVAKTTGISKSNVYTALNGLVTKGAARQEECEAVRYVGVPAEEFCTNHIKILTGVRKRLVEEQPIKKKEQEGYITIQSSVHISNKISSMLECCEKRLYIMADGIIMEQFEAELRTLATDNRKVVILTDADIDIEGAIMYRTPVDAGQIRLITDSSYVLTGELTGSDEDTCLYSGRTHLVEVMKEALKNKIMLLEQKV